MPSNTILFVTLSTVLLLVSATSTHLALAGTHFIGLTDSRNTFHPTVIQQVPQNKAVFTQGLLLEDENVYISSGLYQRSFLLKQPMETLEKNGQSKQQRYNFNDTIFAEGLAVIDDILYVLSWKEETLFRFNKHNLTLIDTLNYQGEGWGLTDNQQELIMSDGSDQLIFRNKNDFSINKTLAIKDLDLINELEYVEGLIWANRWYDDNIYAIDIEQACVVASIDLNSLRSIAQATERDQIANGIAYDPKRQGLWVTGKFWSSRFLIQLPTFRAVCR